MLPAVDVSCRIELEAQGSAELALQVGAVGGVGQLVVRQGGRLLPWQVAATAAGGLTHLVQLGAGEVAVVCTAQVPARPESTARPTDLERIVALRPSRYCPSDRVGGLASDLLGLLPDDPWERVQLVVALVRRRTQYVIGSSSPTDDALDTLLLGQGVCRDFAHLVCLLCRAVDVPARLVSVYAPGLYPMDFHAVVEVAVDDVWRVVDATGLAPRPSMVRIATGRDAADTAFVTTVGAEVLLRVVEVTAVAVGELPQDRPVSLA